MQDFLKWLASLKGIVIDDAAKLRFELSGFPTGGQALLVIAAIVAALVAVVAIYRRDAHRLSGRRRLVLAALRCAALLTAVAIALEPNIVAVKKEERPGHVLLLIDSSQSMTHRDAFRRAEVADLAAAWRRLGVADPATVRRIDLERALLEHEDQRLVRELSRRNRVLAYSFDTGIEPLAITRDDGSADAGEVRLASPESLPADGRYSNIGGAVRSALERSRDAAVAGVILLTDGRRNTGPRGAEIARLLDQRKVPHTLVLGIGDPSETQSIELSRLEAPQKVFRRDPFRVTAELSAQGYDQVNVTVQLRRESADGGPAELVDSAVVQLGGVSPEATASFDRVTSAQPGVFTYRVDVVPPSGEPAVAERHSARTQIEVLDEQTRVLLIAGGPSHEYRILQMELTRDKSIELRCWLTSADPNFPQEGNVSIEGLPTNADEMDEIDVVILMDPDATKLSAEFCGLLARHVEQDGAGMWWVCGEKFTLEALRDSASTKPLADLLPVEPDIVHADRRVIGFANAFEREWPYELTPAGREDKIAQLVDRSAENEILWRQLPGYYFAFPVLRAKPAATTLVALTNPVLAPSDGEVPLIAYQFVGAGRVIFTGTDETYRWRSVFPPAYHSLWVKGLRFLFEGRLTAGNSRMQIQLGSDKIELGQAVKVTVYAKDDARQPLTEESVVLVVTPQAGEPTRITLAAIPQSPGTFEAMLRPPATGFFTLAPAVTNGHDVEATLQVVPAAIEREGPVDLTELQSIASAAGGELLATPGELLDRVEEIPSLKVTDVFRTPHAIWDTWVTIAALVGLLATEWWLRKRWNLL